MHPRARPASSTPQHRESSLSATSEGVSPLTFGGASPIGEDGPVTTGSPDPGLEWWTTSDVAAYLDVRVGTVSSYRIRGQMPEPDQTIGRTHIWRPQRIIEWHAARSRAGVGGRSRSDTTAATNGQAAGESQIDSISEVDDSEDSAASDLGKNSED